MYAHLYFPGNTSTGAQIRDITRLITSCTSSTASLTGLEFIDTNNSTVVGGNSGWSLHSSSTLPTAGTAVSTSTDSRFILEGTCVTSSKTKYCGLSCNGDWNNTSVVTGDDFAFTLSSVLDPGTGTEMFGNGYTSTNSAIGDINGICGNTEHSDLGIHIFADARRILIHGKDGNNHVCFMVNAEFTETATTTAETLVPVAQLFCCDQNRNHGGYNSALYRGNGIWQSGPNSVSYPWIQFSESNFSYNPTYYGKIRCTGWTSGNPNDWNRGGGGEAQRLSSRLDDGTQYGSTTDEGTVGKGQSYYYAWGPHSNVGTFSCWGPHVHDDDYDASTTIDFLWGRSNAVGYDSSGNPGLALHKFIWCNDGNLNHDVYDFSTLGNFWRVAAGLGTNGDTVTIGSDVYVYLNTNDGTTIRPLSAILVKST